MSGRTQRFFSSEDKVQRQKRAYDSTFIFELELPETVTDGRTLTDMRNQVR